MKVLLSVEKTFERGMKSLPPTRAKAVKAAILKFVADPSTPGLDFRTLKGCPDHFIIDPHKGDRIILRKVDVNTYALVDVGPHDNIYRRWNRK